MAGDVEEFRINFQEDFVLSGSISFGRYENESLAWERRSSFSHNRYLEEVEKYSKPGSVNEKKAYFEAHFKKKGGLLGQNSPVSHNGLVYHIIENGASEKVDQGSDFEIVNKQNHNGHFDDSSDNPEDQGDHEVTEFGMPNPGVSFTDPKVGASLGSVSCSMDGALKDVNAEIKEQGDSEENKLPTFVGGLDIEIKQSINNIASIENVSHEAMDSSPKTDLVKRAGKSSSESQQTLSMKMTSKRETKASKSQVNVHQIRRSISGDAFKSPRKVSNKSKGGPPQIICTEEHSSKTATLSPHAVRRTTKIVDSKVPKGKAVLEGRSGGKGRTLREAYSSPLKLESRSYQKTTRHNQAVNSAMQDTGKSASSSNFRSNESLERRKRFHLKLEDKMRIKEADRFKSQVRTQGKAETEAKKVRKYHDIKLKPIPSSYGAVRPESNGKKAVFNSTKVRNTLRKSTAVGLSSHLPLGKDTGPSASGALNTSKNISCHKAVHVEASTNSSIPSAHKQFLPEAVLQIENLGKKDQVKKDPDVQKSRVSESCGESKGQGVEGKQKVGARRSMNLMGRKDIKGVAGSGLGCLAVGVAS